MVPLLLQDALLFNCNVIVCTWEWNFKAAATWRGKQTGATVAFASFFVCKEQRFSNGVRVQEVCSMNVLFLDTKVSWRKRKEVNSSAMDDHFAAPVVKKVRSMTLESFCKNLLVKSFVRWLKLYFILLWLYLLVIKQTPPSAANSSQACKWFTRWSSSSPASNYVQN